MAYPFASAVGSLDMSSASVASQRPQASSVPSDRPEYNPAPAAFVQVTCPKIPYAPPTTMLLEPGGSDLAPGLLLSPSLVAVENGVVFVPVVNVGATGAAVHCKQVFGTLHVVEGIEGSELSFEEEH
ncbi:hypothetical protein F7725_026946, partial [Dissostichus mawsoni]